MRQAAPEDTRSGASPTWEERDRGSLIKLGFSWSAMSPLSRFRAHEFTALDDRYALVCRLLEESDGFVAAAAVLLCSLTFFLLDISVPSFVLIAFWPCGKWAMGKNRFSAQGWMKFITFYRDQGGIFLIWTWERILLSPRKQLTHAISLAFCPYQSLNPVRSTIVFCTQPKRSLLWC